MNVFVTNRSDTDLTVGFDGVTYEFKKNRTVELPYEGAVRLFGYKQQDREHILVRYGWITLHSELELGIKKVDQFVITETKETDTLLPSRVGVVPLLSEKRVAGKTQSRAA